MLELSESALNEFKEYFADHDQSPIRVYLGHGGCSGPQLLMALDQKNDDDKAFEFDDITVIVNSALLEKAQPIKVDKGEYGFTIDSNLEMSAGGGCGCSSAGSCGSPGSCCH